VNRAWWFVGLGILMVPVVAFMGMLMLSSTLAGASQQGTPGECATGSSSSTTLASLEVSAGSRNAIKLNAAQLQNAATIVAVGQSLKVSTNGLKIALMVALQESTLRNLANANVPASLGYPNEGVGRDHDSVNVFQQRPASGWGTVQDLMDPTYAAKAFFGGPTGPNGGSPRGLLDIANWEAMSPTKAAQTVQVSAFPDAYAKWEGAASSILDAAGSTGVSCDTQTASGSWQAPNGKTGQDLVDYAEQFVGKVPYTGACGTAGSPEAGWCCTGFVYYMYHQVLGIELPSPWVGGQLAMATRIPVSEAQAGDLVAWEGHHIGIWDGKGGMIHSPDYGRMLEHLPKLSLDYKIGSSLPSFWRVNTIGSGTW
jgi:cell wall-associated NlpC family hydrolase